MNKELRLGRKFLCLLIALVMVMTLIPRLPASFAYAQVGDVPDHAKILQVNPDGTYTLALNVKGDSEKKIQHVNVIVIVDRSGSMDEQSGTGAYVATNSTGTGLYGFVDGEYVPLTRQGGPGNRTFWYNGVQYTGQRYQYDNNATRLEATQAAVNGLANNLLSYNGKDDNPDDVVEMALVSFSTNARTDVAKTTSPGTYTNAVNALTQGGGTNWEAALSQANGINFGDSDPTYVIFFSDGAPTFHSTDGGYGNWNQQYGVYGSGGETEPNMERSYNQATDDAATLATKVGVNNFYTIFAYGTATGSTYMTNLTSAAGAPSGNNYSASNTAELNDAFDEILESIEMAGIGNVDMTDGTTSNVTTSTGTAHLLDVDDSTFKYYRAGGDDGNGNEKYESDTNTITDTEGNTIGIGEEWTGEGVPPAVFNDATGAVEWDLGDNFILENDVTYTVTFDCWPSQDTLDLVADIRNDPSVYDGLDPEIKKYLDPNGNLRTNTTTSITWTDTRPGGGDGESEFNTVEPVTTTAVEQLAVTKKWENALDGQEAKALDLTVARDGEDKYDVLLSSDNDWTDNVFISTGIMRTHGDEVELLTSGHDFTFTEPADLGYYWELDVPVVRPMIINGGKPKTLIRVDENHPGEGYTHYTLPDYQVDEDTVIPGGDYYLDEAAGVGLTATNHRRARLNLTKVVDGEDADPDQEFEFTLNVVDSKASEGSESNLNSDYWIWFSVWNGEYIDALVSGAEKEMDDETGEWTGFYYAPSGSDIVVNLKAGDNLRVINLPTDSTYTFTEGTLPQNYTFTSSELGAKTWDEEGQEVVVDPEEADPTFSGAQTTTGTIEATNMDYTVTYTNTYDLSDVEITKVWNDADDQDGKRPTKEEFKAWLKLMADGEDVTSANASKLAVTESEDEEGNTIYTAKWTGLDRYAEGEEIEYSVTETPSADYTADKTTVDDHGTITNTHEPEVTDITVNKTWVGPEAANGASITLKANGTAVSGEGITNPVTLSTSNNNTYTWEDLPKCADGSPITYTVEEAVITGYSTTGPTGTGTADDPFVFKNVNDETTEVYVRKVWVGPASTATINLLADGEETDLSVTLPNQGSNEYTFENLRKYDATTGEEIEYTVTEDPVSGYTTTGPTGSGTENAPYTFTNTSDERTTVSVEKVWDDDNDRDGKRPDSVTVHLKANGQDVTQQGITAEQDLEADDWAYTWENLYKYDQTTGAEITYTVIEDAVTDYTPKEGDPAGTGTANDPYVFTNSYEPGKTSVTVTKAWEDGDDRDGIRPASVQVTLLADGKAVTQEGITAAQTLNEENNWTYTWSGLNQKEAGVDIVYTVAETETAVITGTDGPGTYAYEVTGSAANGYTVTNTHTPETVEVPVEKVWEDADDQDGIRPTSVEVTLLADGTAVTQEGITAAQTLSETNEWTYTWTGLYKYADGEEIAYTVAETTTSVITGTDGPGTYAYEVTGSAANGYTVTNTHTPEVVEVSVEKVWEDADDQDGIRPASVTVTLLADGAAVTQEGITAAQTLDEDNDWAYTWEGLNKYADGEEIVYTVEETETAVITGTDGAGTYAYEVTGDAEEGYTVTNTHTPETIEVPVEKVWSDGDDQDGIRPDSVEVTLLADGEAVTQTGITAAQTLSESNSWSYTWEGLNKYADGEEIAYTVAETTTSVITGTDGPGTYAISYSGDVGEGLVVTNTHTPEVVEASVKKVWDDNNNQDGFRPDTLEVTLSDGQKVTLSESNNWTATITDLPKYDDGELITYTWTEASIEDYTLISNETVGTLTTLTNKHTPEVTEASVKKVWDDADNQDGIRPQSLVVTLSDGQTVTLDESNNWTGKITGLDKYKDGELITYTWTEADIDDYTLINTATEGTLTTLTNQHTPEQTEATVKKVWLDADNQDGFRPDSITVKLLADGVDTGKSVTLSDDNEWTDTIDELDKFKAGAEISYTWDEGDIEKYTLSKTEKDPADATITTLTNTHEPEKVVVEVEKVWEDADNQDGIRPESVTVKLLADGEDVTQEGVVATQTLSESNSWKYTWEDLDKYSEGKEIEYTVEEVEVPEGYEADVTGNAAPADEEGSDEPKPIGYIVTNTHEPELIDITVLKVWEDVDDQDGFRPEDVTISLLADGEDTGKTVSLTEANQWTNTFKDLYKYKVGAVGQEVVYTIDESKVPKGYEVAIEGTVEDGFTVTNSHTPEVVEVSVEKVWDDADDRDGIRPDSVTVTLLANGDDVTQEGITPTVELNEENNWKYTWEGLNKRAAGQVISYTVKEEPVPEGYEVEITGDAEKGFTVKNFHLAKPVPVMIDPPVKKVVKGNPSKDETFTFQMKAVTKGAPMPEGAKDGVMTMDIVGSGEKEFGEAWFTEAGTYVYEITEVDGKVANYKYDGTVYTLTVEVKEVADGTQVKLEKTETIKGGDAIVFTNTYEEPPVKTGDTTIVVPYIVIGAASLILLLMLLFRTRKNRA